MGPIRECFSLRMKHALVRFCGIDDSDDDMHHNKRSSHVRWCWVIVVGGTCSNDMRRASSLLVRRMSISEPAFPYHRLAASCTSAERDLHTNGRAIGNSGTITRS
jgi:hypothetical protein